MSGKGLKKLSVELGGTDYGRGGLGNDRSSASTGTRPSFGRSKRRCVWREDRQAWIDGDSERRHWLFLSMAVC